MIYVIYTVYSAVPVLLTAFNNALKLSFVAHVIFLSFMISVELPVNPACMSARIEPGTVSVTTLIFLIHLIVQVTNIITQKM